MWNIHNFCRNLIYVICVQFNWYFGETHSAIQQCWPKAAWKEAGKKLKNKRWIFLFYLSFFTLSLCCLCQSLIQIIYSSTSTQTDQQVGRWGLDALASLRPIMDLFTFLRLLHLELEIVSDCFNNVNDVNNTIIPTISIDSVNSISRYFEICWDINFCKSVFTVLYQYCKSVKRSAILDKDCKDCTQRIYCVQIFGIFTHTWHHI